ncbi:MAG: undecaprenyldiphospho-muramoylpentapeptide beta-N-acetylglucosaminyltransferase [Ignavibacteria bacterium]|nr:undecaprenyldiphospho-muramoylpentapeptide beta-N-acetylglucosaminyltransferase [Ignavibacteria bacterium]
MRFLFAAGGTGGHIYPAIAIADELKKMTEKTEILFVGAEGKIEEKIVPANNYKLVKIKISGFNLKNIVNTLKLPFMLISALKNSKKIILEFNPDVVIGTGGFVSGPVLYKAVRLKKPVLIQEGNAYPGKVVRFLAKKADKVIVNFDKTADFLPDGSNIQKISHPVRITLKKTDKASALNAFDFKQDLKTLLIFGGSQGAHSINEAIKKYIKDLYELKINILWQTGKKDYDSINTYVRSLNLEVGIKVLEYIDDMGSAYSLADLVICRGGISTIMELSYLKMPAVIVPYPYAAENHQEVNARTLEENNACVVVTEKIKENKEKYDFSQVLFNTIKKVLSDEALRKKLSENISRYSDENAARKIAEEILKLRKN